MIGALRFSDPDDVVGVVGGEVDDGGAVDSLGAAMGDCGREVGVDVEVLLASGVVATDGGSFASGVGPVVSWFGAAAA